MAMRREPRRRWLRWVIGLVALVVVLLIAAVVASSLIPVDTIRDRLVAQVKESTGRDLAIKGGLSVSVFPTLTVNAKDVTFSNAPWAAARPMASLAALDVRLKLLPLLSGQVEIASFALDKPDIDLETDKSGRGNWEFGPAQPASAAPKAGAKPAETPAAGGSGTGSAISEIALGDVHISNGRVTYKDGVTGKTEVADAINLKVSLPTLDQPLSVDGSLKWHDKAVQLTLDAAKPRALLAAAGSTVGLKLASDPIKLNFAGTLALAGAPKGAGDLDLSVPSIRALVQWATGQALTAPGDGLGPLSIKGKASIDGPKYALSGAQIALDGQNANGDVAVATGGARPAIKGKLAVDKLDLDHYMAPASGDKGASASADKNAAAKPAAPQPAASSGWSADPIDVSGLKAADVNLALSAGAIQIRKIAIGKTGVQIVLENGRLTLDLTEMALYQGNVKGRVAVDGSGPAIAADANLIVDKVQVQPLLLATADTDRVSGVAQADTQLSSRGKSEKDLVGALTGKGQLALKNGVIKGIDLVGAVKSAAASVTGDKGETSFASAGGTYAITAGILTNKDFVLDAPTISATGAGTVDLPKRALDYKLSAKLLGALAVPVNVKGPWDDISYGVDVAGLVKENAGNAGKLLGKGVEGAGGAAGAVGNAAGGAAKALGGLGKKLFGN